MSAPTPSAENPHAGRSAVVLDIGGDVGALIVHTPVRMAGVEVEIVPAGTKRVSAQDQTHLHTDDVAHHHHPGRDGEHDHAHADDSVPVLVGKPGAPTPHVAVVVRPLPNGEQAPTLVFGKVLAGRYDLYLKPDGPVALTVDVAGATVTEARWPD